MARRINALIPLSWDHHHGLVLARTLSATLAGDARFGDPSPEAMRARVRDRWEAELSGHFEDEEALIAPLAEEHDGLVGPVARMREQHRAIRGAVERVQGAGEASLEGALSDFARELTDHIRFEERELFPAVEERLDPATAHELGLRLVARREAAGRSSPRERAAVKGTLLEPE